MREEGYSYWCYAAQRVVKLKGPIVGRRVAEVLRIYDCELPDCIMRQSHDCLIGKDLEGTHKENEKKETIERNVSIIQRNLKSANKINHKRLEFAIYRLYRYLGLSPSDIAYLTQIKEAKIRTIVGRVFKRICLTDPRCVLKPYLSKEEARGKNS